MLQANGGKQHAERQEAEGAKNGVLFSGDGCRNWRRRKPQQAARPTPINATVEGSGTAVVDMCNVQPVTELSPPTERSLRNNVHDPLGKSPTKLPSVAFGVSSPFTANGSTLRPSGAQVPVNAAFAGGIKVFW